jgi:caffeoyl-CoA O-methyltransferase
VERERANFARMAEHDETNRFDGALAGYAEAHSGPEPALLAELRRATWLEVIRPQMLSDPLQGRVLSVISRMVRPRRILELGTYTGYATLCLAEGLEQGGRIDTVESNDELNAIQDQFWKRSPWAEQILRHNGEAHEVMKKLNGPYDLVWIDADKKRTATYIEEALKLTRIGGWILVDNVLWWGKVLDGEASSDADARRLHAINAALYKDERVEGVVLPIRDGIHVIQRVK